MTTEQLDVTAQWKRKILKINMAHQRGGGFLDRPIDWVSWKNEADQQFMLGGEDYRHGHHGSCSSRLQGEDAKRRVSDNYHKVSRFNSSFGSSSYLGLQDTDFFRALFIPMIGPPLLKGRGFDLSQTYKHFAIHAEFRSVGCEVEGSVLGLLCDFFVAAPGVSFGLCLQQSHTAKLGDFGPEVRDIVYSVL